MKNIYSDSRNESCYLPAGDVLFLWRAEVATVYKVKDGPYGDRTDEGKEIQISILTEKLANHTCQYLTDDPPQFNIDNPSSYYRHVVIEVSDEGELNYKFPRKGFYVVANLDVTESAFIYK